MTAQEQIDQDPKKIPILPVDPEQFIYKDIPEYITINDEFFLFGCFMRSKLNLLIEGEKGLGKTLSVAAWASKNKIPIIQCECSETTQEDDLIGNLLPIDGNIVYKLGPLPAAIQVANQCGKAVLCFEELNALSPSTQKVLNQMLDWRKGRVFVSDINRTFHLKPDSSLLVVATMNPAGYGGTYSLNDDLASRFEKEIATYPDQQKLQKIIQSQTEITGYFPQMLRLLQELRASKTKGDISYEPSPRDLVSFYRLYNALKMEIQIERPLLKALRLSIINKTEDESERVFIQTRINSIFGSVLLQN